MGDRVFRNKVTWFSFGFSLLVIWVHSYNAELYLGKTPQMAAVYRLQHSVGDGIAQIAVPGFFMISGYLFYRDFTWDKLGEKWQRRIRSVLAPYILWNFLYYMGYVVGSRLPWMTDVVGKGVVPFHLYAVVDAVINYTYNYVFWYLFQLILLILLAPVLYPVLRCRWSRAGLLLGLWWLVVAGRELPLINADALIYYATAASFALDGKRWVEGESQAAGRLQADRETWVTGKSQVDRGARVTGKSQVDRETQAYGINEPGYRQSERRRMAGGIILVGLAVLVYQAGLRMACVPCFVLCRLMAVAGLWLAVPGERLPEAKDFMCHNFFLYGVHFAFVRFINKAGTRVLPAVPAVPLLLYLLMPLLVLGIAAVLGKVLRRWTPRVWGVLNGGR